MEQEIIHVSEWQRIYDQLLARASVDDVITYAQLDEVLGRPFLRCRNPIYRAQRELGECRHRWLDVVKGKGYRVIHAREHVGKARQHESRGRRQYEKTGIVLRATELADLSPTELQIYDEQQKVNVFHRMVLEAQQREISEIRAILRRNNLE